MLIVCFIFVLVISSLQAATVPDVTPHREHITSLNIIIYLTQLNAGFDFGLEIVLFRNYLHSLKTKPTVLTTGPDLFTASGQFSRHSSDAGRASGLF